MKNKINVVDAVNIASISLLVPVSDEFPVLKELLAKNPNFTPHDWEFCMTVAGAGVALGKNSLTGEKRAEIVSRLHEIDKNMPNALEDFFSFTDGELSEKEMVAKVGLWVLWNVKRSEPTYAEAKDLAPFLGTYLNQIVSEFAGKDTSN